MTSRARVAVQTGIVQVRLICDPDLAAEIGERLCRELPNLLATRVADEVTWKVRSVVAPLAGDEQVSVTALADAIPDTVDDDDWDVLVFITDLPRRSGLRPVAAELLPDERVALVSLPALGFLRLYARARAAVVRLIPEMMATDHQSIGNGGWTVAGPSKHPRLRTMTSRGLPIANDFSGNLRIVGQRRFARLRMIGGMVRANRPWRLFLGLSRSMAGVFATAAYGFINLTAWRMGTQLGPLRQTILAISSVILLVVWLIVDHELWERPQTQEDKRRARMYNKTTVITLAAGVLCLYLELFVLLFFVQQLLLSPTILAATLGTTGTWASDLAIVWFITSAAVIGGALGSGFEDDRVVSRAAYGARQRERQRQRKERESERNTASRSRGG